MIILTATQEFNVQELTCLCFSCKHHHSNYGIITSTNLLTYITFDSPGSEDDKNCHNRVSDQLFPCNGSQFQIYFIHFQFVQPKLVTIMERRNVDKVCENKLLVDLKSFKLF